jgi:hypothetical protein
MSSPDDDALSWDGDEERVSRPPEPRASRPRERTLPRGWRAVGRGSDAVSTSNGDEDADGDATGPEHAARHEAAPVGNAALVGFGVLGGVYALFVIGWGIGGFRLRDSIQATTGAVADVMFQAALWLALLAPVIWFLVTLYATRHAPRWQRFAGLAVGVLLLVPWPFVMMGAMGR